MTAEYHPQALIESNPMAPDEKKRMNFTGQGFSSSEFTESERAEMRERAYHFDRNFLSSDDFLEETNLSWVAAMAKGFPAFIKAFLAISAIGGGILVMQSMGIL